ncbi:MAG: hypothetical protein ABSH01_09220 [Terriglobia bacterium]|jgi:hypothetical protein
MTESKGQIGTAIRKAARNRSLDLGLTEKGFLVATKGNFQRWVVSDHVYPELPEALEQAYGFARSGARGLYPDVYVLDIDQDEICRLEIMT